MYTVFSGCLEIARNGMCVTRENKPCTSYEMIFQSIHMKGIVFLLCTCRNSQGGWSDEQMEVVDVTREGDIVTVTCAGHHLTNFAVLVDVGGTHVNR